MLTDWNLFEQVAAMEKDQQMIVKPSFECSLDDLSRYHQQVRAAYYKAANLATELRSAAETAQRNFLDISTTLNQLEWELFKLEEAHGLTGVTRYATGEVIEADKERTNAARGDDVPMSAQERRENARYSEGDSIRKQDEEEKGA